MQEAVIEKRIPIQTATHRNDVLKILAMVTMLIDHIGYMYFPHMLILRTIGRLAFPIFAYQLAIGYSKTSNLKRYVLRLLVFAIITQIPYMFFNPALRFFPLHFNILFMFLAAIGAMYTYDLGVKSIKEYKETKYVDQLRYGIIMFAITFVITFLPEVIYFNVPNFSFEYGALGIAMVLLFHIFENNKPAAIISIILLYFLHSYYMVALGLGRSRLFWKFFFRFGFVWKKMNENNTLLHLAGRCINARGLFALIPIYMLQKVNFDKIRLNKYIGYAFYPLHIAIIVIIAVLIK